MLMYEAVDELESLTPNGRWQSTVSGTDGKLATPA
jgi:hypothetical protein